MDIGHSNIEISFLSEGQTKAKAIGNDIISCSVSKDLKSGAGQFSFVAKATSREFIDQVRFFDSVAISFIRGKEKGIVMLGLLDAVHEHESASLNDIAKRFMFSGLDFGRVISEFEVMMDEHINKQLVKTIAKFLCAVGDSNKQVKTIVEKIKTGIVEDSKINNYAGVKYNGQTVAEMLLANMKLSGTKEEQTAVSISEINGTFWEYAKRVANLPMNELYMTTHGGKLQLVLRENHLFIWDSLEFIEVEDTDVIDMKIGRSTSNIVNFVKFLPIGAVQEEFGTLVSEPLFDIASINKYGIRKMKVSSPVMGIKLVNKDPEKAPKHKDTAKRKKEVKKQINVYTKKVWDVYSKSHTWYTGTLTVKGSPKYAAGKRIQHRGRKYYVESVSHSWQAMGQYTTSMTLSGGRKR